VSPANVPTASPLRAWWYLVWLSWQRHARAHLLVWIAVGLLALTVIIVFINSRMGRWNMSYWRSPRPGAPHWEDVSCGETVGHLPLDTAMQAVQQAVWGAYYTVVFESSGFYVFSNGIVFSLFATFLLPMWSLSFATEGLGREREGRNLIWLLIRPLPRWS